MNRLVISSINNFEKGSGQENYINSGKHFTSSHQMCSLKKVLLKISQNSQGKTPVSKSLF